MGIEKLLGIFGAKASQLYWERLPADHVASGASDAPIENDKAYFVVRMKEMYLHDARVLWRKYYPMLHAFVGYGQVEEQAVAGPGQLREFGEANLERIVNLNFRLAGPIAYKGDDVSLLVGLYSVPGQDAARALIDTVGTLASLGGLALGQTAQIAAAVKDGVEKIVGLNDATLQLGVRDSFFSGNPLRAGYHVGIAAEATRVDGSRLWLNGQGRLVYGDDPPSGQPYSDHDFMVIEIERRDTRDDWAALPDIAPLNDEFRAIMTDSGTTPQQKREKLRELWPHFTQVLAACPQLVRPDADGIAERVGADLAARLQAMESNNPFEARSMAVRGREPHPEDFDFAFVPGAAEWGGAAGATESLTRAPF